MSKIIRIFAIALLASASAIYVVTAAAQTATAKTGVYQGDRGGHCHSNRNANRKSIIWI